MLRKALNWKKLFRAEKDRQGYEYLCMLDDRPFTAAHGGWWYGRYKSVRKGQPKQLQPLKSQNKSGHGKSVHGNEVMY